MQKNRKVILIGGGSGSGKSTLAEQLLRQFGEKRAALLCIDRYYHSFSHLSEDERAKINFDHPDSIDWEFLHSQLDLVFGGEQVVVPEYDYVSHARVEGEPFEAREILILEGILALHSEFLRRLSDIKVFVDTGDNIRFERRRVRDIAERGRTAESVAVWWDERVQPMYVAYCAPMAQYADLKISGEIPFTESISQIASKFDPQSKPDASINC